MADLVTDPTLARLAGGRPVLMASHHVPLRMDDRPSGWNEADEVRFQQWYASVAQQFGLDPNPDSPLHAYNYRHAFKSGAWPDLSAHWPSTFKAANHPARFVDGRDTTSDK